MIGKNIQDYCCENISKIENYDKAINDKTQIWVCHHKAEILPCGKYSANDLKKFGLFYYRQANELIFMTRGEHSSLHNKGKISSNKGKRPSENTILKLKLNQPHRKPVSQYTKDGKLIATFNSIKEAGKYTGISYSGISKCCSGELKSTGGFVWRYA